MSATAAPSRKLAAIVFADIVGYTKWVHEDEAHALERRRQVEQVIKAAATSQNGRIVKFLGDGAMLEFPSAVNAVSCALEIQTGIAPLNTERNARKLQMRIGIHVGDVIEEGFDLYGTGVNIASRVQTMAAPGGICITREVYAQIKPILKLSCNKVSSLPEKDLPEPIDVFQVGEPGNVSARIEGEIRWQSAALVAVALCVWMIFCLTWNVGVAWHSLITYSCLTALGIAARKLYPEAIGAPLRGLERLILIAFGFSVAICIYIFLVAAFSQSLDLMWAQHSQYKVPRAYSIADVRAFSDQFTRWLPSVAASGPFDVRAPAIDRGFYIKNVTAFLQLASPLWYGVLVLGTFAYLIMLVGIVFCSRHDGAGKKKVRNAIFMLLAPLPAAFAMTSVPWQVNVAANPVPIIEYHLNVPLKVSAFAVQQWSHDLDLDVSESAVFPVHSVATGAKVASVHIGELREVDAFSRWRRTGDGMTILRPPFQFILIGNDTQSHIQVNFGNQPEGKIPKAYQNVISALEKRFRGAAQPLTGK